jgi:hypothetical protein
MGIRDRVKTLRVCNRRYNLELLLASLKIQTLTDVVFRRQADCGDRVIGQPPRISAAALTLLQ